MSWPRDPGLNLTGWMAPRLTRGTHLDRLHFERDIWGAWVITISLSPDRRAARTGLRTIIAVPVTAALTEFADIGRCRH